MTSDFQPKRDVGRRSLARLRLGVPARLITLYGVQDVLLDDLSLSGAQIRLSDGEQFSSGVLEWLDFDELVDVVWHDGSTYGVKFEKHLPKGCILATRDAAPALLDDEARARSVARQWTEGTLN